jgi:hypothetical protein
VPLLVNELDPDLGFPLPTVIRHFVDGMFGSCSVQQ